MLRITCRTLWITNYVFPLAILSTLTLALFVAGSATAQQPTPSDDQVNNIAKQLYCPVCENIPLDVCPTTACAEWRELIRQKLSAGWSEQQIKAYFVEQYGDRVLGTPPARGLNWLIYVIPPIAILAGAFILYHAVQSWHRPAQQGTQEKTVPENPPNEYVARLEEELRNR